MIATVDDQLNHLDPNEERAMQWFRLPNEMPDHRNIERNLLRNLSLIPLRRLNKI